MSDAPKQEIIPASESAPAPTAVALSDEANLMNLIAKMAADPSYDVARLERLVALRNEELARQRKSAYLADFVPMKPQLPLVIKTHRNDHTKSTFAKHEDINKVIDPILAKFNLGTSAKVIKQTESDVTMVLEINHRDGHIETMELTMPIDDKGSAGNTNKTKIQGISSTITQIKKVGFCAMLNISAGDDKDGNAPTEDDGLITIEQAAELDKRLRALGEDALPRFLKWAKVEKLPDLTKRNYNKAVKAIAHQETEAKGEKS